VIPNDEDTSTAHIPNESTSPASKYNIPDRLLELPAPVFPVIPIGLADPLYVCRPLISTPKLNTRSSMVYSTEIEYAYHPVDGQVNDEPDTQFQSLNVVALWGLSKEFHVIGS
jgi:hypothetical protein